MSEPAAHMVDVSFAISAGALPEDHRRLLASALDAALPWLAQEPGVGVHRLNLSGGAGHGTLLSRRTRLTLRVPRARASQAQALAGTALQLGGVALHLGPALQKELLPFGTLYAHFVAADAGEAGDELAFLSRTEAALQRMGVQGRTICGRSQTLEAGALQGWGLMIDHLSGAHSLCLQESGLGQHRLLGCGIFVPHKSAAAVGAPH
jgi:CRISPR-associated protein Cas6